MSAVAGAAPDAAGVAPDDQEPPASIPVSSQPRAKAKLQLCTEHGQNPVEVCSVCRCVLSILRPEIRKQVL